MGKVFVQIGAGAGDQDIRISCRDGFTEYVKSLDPASIEQIVLVEPNAFNIDLLKKCWADYPQAEIHQLGIRPKRQTTSTCRFFFAREDAPHYQVCSLNKEHVLMHYPNAELQSFETETVTLEDLLKQTIGDKTISALSIDIEGAEGEIIPEIDWRTVKCEAISYEHLHLGGRASAVEHALRRGGFMYAGSGFDHQGFDYLWRRPSSTLDWLLLSVKNALRQIFRV
jgi:hypothetical protein